MNDLVLFEFAEPLSQEQFERNGYRDPVCRLEEVTFDTKLIAIGYAQNSTGKFKNLFLCDLSTPHSLSQATTANCSNRRCISNRTASAERFRISVEWRVLELRNFVWESELQYPQLPAVRASVRSVSQPVPVYFTLRNLMAFTVWLALPRPPLTNATKKWSIYTTPTFLKIPSVTSSTWTLNEDPIDSDHCDRHNILYLFLSRAVLPFYFEYIIKIRGKIHFWKLT